MPKLFTLHDLHNQTLENFQKNGGGTVPYQNYELLKLLCALYKPQNGLECGSGLGLTAIAMSLGSPNMKIVSIDKNESNTQIATQNAKNFQVDPNIKFVTGMFLDIISQIQTETLDLVFFDGFAPGYKIFLELERVLKKDGLMIMANLKLRGDVRKITAKMSDIEFYQHYFRLEDTAFGIKR